MNNGLIWNRMAQEFEIWLDGEHVGWSSNETTGQQLYNQALHQKCEHSKHMQAWELHTSTVPDVETIEALDQAFLDTEPLQVFKTENGLGIACSYCEQVANQQGKPLAYDPSKVSHGVCPSCFAVQMELLERWVAEQKTKVVQV